MTSKKEAEHTQLLLHHLPPYHLQLLHPPKRESLKEASGGNLHRVQRRRTLTLTCSTLVRNSTRNKTDGLSLKEVSQDLLSMLLPSCRKHVEEDLEGAPRTVPNLEVSLK